MSRTATAVAVSLLLITAGCSGFVGDEGGEAGSGTISFYISDQQNDIGDFQSLNVTITEIAFHPANASENESWVTRDINDRTVDLTKLQGDNASLLGNVSVPANEYDKVFVHVGSLEGTLTSGDTAKVKLPSEKLQLSTTFSVEADQETSFVYDVTVIETGSGMYILKPQAAESGTDKPINRVDGRPGDAGTQTTTASGSMDLYLSDQPNAIDDFQSLNVTITEIGVHAKNASSNESWMTVDVDNRTADLTKLKGDNATLLGNLELPAGEYTKVFVHVSEVNGTLNDGSHPPVKLPSKKLQLSVPFAIEANETTSFVYDVGVFETGSGKYIIKPQVGQSGPDKPVDQVSGERDDDEDNQTTNTTSAY